MAKTQTYRHLRNLRVIDKLAETVDECEQLLGTDLTIEALGRCIVKLLELQRAQS